MALKRGRGDILAPARPTPGAPIVSYPTPVIADVVVREDVQVSPHQYKPLPYGTPHPLNDETGLDLRLVWQGPPSGDSARKTVTRIYATPRTAQNIYNYSLEFSEESNQHPIYIRSYLELRKNYAPLTKGSRFTGIVAVDVTAGGDDYDPDFPPTVVVSGGGGSGAILRAVIYERKVAYLQILNEGTGYTTIPTISFTNPSGGHDAAAVAAIQPAGAILVSEKMQRIEGEDPKLASLFVRVHRVYKVLPGPPMLTKKLGQPNLMPEKYRRLVRVVETDQEVSADYAFPSGLVGDQSSIELQQKTIVEARLKIIEEIINTTGDALVGGELGEYGPLRIYETVVPEGTAIDEGFLIFKSSVSPFGDGRAVKITVKYPNNLDQIVLRGQELDQSLNAVFPYRLRVTPAGSEIGLPNREITPMDYLHSKVRELDLSGRAVLDTYLLAFPSTGDVRAPDVLAGFDILEEENINNGLSSESVDFYLFSGNHSFTFPLRAVAQGSAIFTKEVVPNIIPFYGTNRSTTNYMFFLPIPVTRQQVIDKLAQLSEIAEVAWPIFNPRHVTFVITSRRVSLQASVGRTYHETATDSGFDQMLSHEEGQSAEIGLTIKTIRLPPTIHGDLTGLLAENGDAVFTTTDLEVEASIPEFTVGGSFVVPSLDVTLVDAPWVRITAFGLEATPGAQELPDSGLLILNVDARPYKYGYAMIRAEVIDASTLV